MVRRAPLEHCICRFLYRKTNTESHSRTQNSQSLINLIHGHCVRNTTRIFTVRYINIIPIIETGGTQKTLTPDEDNKTSLLSFQFLSALHRSNKGSKLVAAQCSVESSNRQTDRQTDRQAHIAHEIYSSVVHSWSVTPTAYLVNPAYKSIDGGVAPSKFLY